MQAVASSSGRIAMAVRTPLLAGADINRARHRRHVAHAVAGVRGAAGRWGASTHTSQHVDIMARRCSGAGRSLAPPGGGSRAQGRRREVAPSAMDSNVGEGERQRDYANMRINTLLLISLFGSLIARGYVHHHQPRVPSQPAPPPHVSACGPALSTITAARPSTTPPP
jgi:hypothetical protein